MTAPDMPAAARTLLKQLAGTVPAWLVDGPRHATGPCVFGGLSEETDGEGKRTRTETIEQVDSVLIRAHHADGRALVALWVQRPTRKGWKLDMAWRGRAAGEHAPHRITANHLRVYVAAPDHPAALDAIKPAVTEPKESEAA